MTALLNRALIVLALCLPSWAWALTVSPVHIQMSPAIRSVTFTAINDQQVPAVISAKLRRWQQQDGQDQLEPATELVIYPLQAKLKPGQKQDFRLYLKGNQQTASYYRLLIELADNSPNKASEIRLGQAFSVPVFVEPLLARPLVQLARKGSGLQLTNTGTGMEFIKAVRYNGKEEPTFLYLLPGAQRQLPSKKARNGQVQWPQALIGRRLGAIAVN